METAIIAGVLSVVIFLIFVAVAATSKTEAPIKKNTGLKQTEEKPASIHAEPDYETMQIIQRRAEIQAFIEYELPCHTRILDESIALICKTNNLFTLLSRYNDVVEQYEWAKKKAQDGYPVSTKNAIGHDYLSYLNCITNENILRIAINSCRVAFEKCWEAKTTKGKQNKLTACFEDIERCLAELKDHENKQQITESLNDLYSQVEDNLSSLLRNEPLKTFNSKEIRAYEPTTITSAIGLPDTNENSLDPLFREAAQLMVSTQQGSSSMLQGTFRLGFNRASRIMDQLENAGIVGAFDGKKTRDVKIKDLDTLDSLLNSLNII